MNFMQYILNLITKKRQLVTVFFFAGLFYAHAQMDIQLNTYWQNPYYITPAYINDVQNVVFTLAGRQQWVGFTGAPRTIYASAASYFEELNMQAGLRIFNDKAGYTSATDISLAYAYSLKLNDNWYANLGVALSYQSLDYDLTKISFEGSDESNIYTSLVSKKNANVDGGVEFYNHYFRIGMSGRNLLSLFNKNNPIYLNTNYIYGTYRQLSNGMVDFGGGVFGIQYGNRIQVEANATAYFKKSEREDFIHTGIIYRTPKEIGAIVGIDLGSNIGLSYCYDYNFGLSSHPPGQTHEVLITYKFNPKPVLRWDAIE